MNAQPKTLALGQREWNVLLAHNAAELAQFFQNQPTPSAEKYVQIIQHIDRMKDILPGWLATAPPVPAGAKPEQVQETAAPQAQPNGAAPVKRKGGWPRGKKRTPKALAQAVQ